MSAVLDINKIKSIARKAGNLIMEVYGQDFRQTIDYKPDESPLTVADKKSHDFIVGSLGRLYPEIPVISEEGSAVPYEERKKWPLFWLVDPLDGTKEFIKKNGQFTVNISLIKGTEPVFGLIYPPCLGDIYYTDKGSAFVEGEDGQCRRLQVNFKKEHLLAVRSRSHSAPEEEELYKKYNVTGFVSKGSALKFCMIAAGEADIYYRFKPTMEWDTAAGQAIVEAAGGKVFKGLTSKRFSYNKPSLLNGSFLCTGF